jgi:hypothetical protein
MRRVLLFAQTNPSWSRRAAAELASFRREPIVNADGTVLLETKSGCEWWTFAGLRGNAALTYAWPFPVSFDNVTIRANVGRQALQQAAKTEWDLAPPKPDRRFRPKFAECLSADQLGRLAWCRLYDRDAADAVHQQPMLYDSSRKDTAST